MMISPQYTPFAAFEVRQALGLTHQAYEDAISTGKLNRSVHFDCRVSSATSLHSLLDVVEFEVSSRAARMGFEKVIIDEWLQYCLDTISYFEETLPEKYEVVRSDEFAKLFRKFLGADSGEYILRMDSEAGDVLITIHDVVDVWLYLYQRLKNFLLIDVA